MTATALLAATASAQVLYRTGIPAGATHSYANGVSSDGSVVAGNTAGATGGDWAGYRAFRWTVSGGLQSLGLQTPTDLYSWGNGISGDGTIVAANSGPRAYQGYTRGCRYTAAGGFVDLGLPPGGRYQYNNGISNDGGTIYGRAEFAGGLQRPALWRAASGFMNLGVLPGMTIGTVNGVSANGNVAVGDTQGNGIIKAWRWTATGGLTELPMLPGGLTYNWASGVSADGTAVVGFGQNGTNLRHAWRHTTVPGGGSFMTDLSVMGPNQETYARAVSAEGAVVVGETSDNQTFIWTERLGMRPLKPWLTQIGFNTAPWTNMHKVAAISLDGSTIIGSGQIGGHDEGWVARGIPCHDPPAIGGDPLNQRACEGQNVNIGATAGGLYTGTLTYRWYKDGVPLVNGNTGWGSAIIGATSSAMTIWTARAADSGSYSLRATNACGSAESYAAYIDVVPVPSIVTPPQESTFCRNLGGSLSVLANVHWSDSAGYAWHRWVMSGPFGTWVPLNDGPQTGGYTLLGTHTPTLIFGSPQPATQAFYACMVTGSCGQVLSSPAYVYIVSGQPLFADPQDATTCSHGPAAFSAPLLQISNGPFTFEWQREASPGNWVQLVDGPTSGWGGCGAVSGTSTDTITFVGAPNMSPADGIRVRCVVTNPCASVLGQPAQLTVCPGDYNCDGGIDGADIDAFFGDWENGFPAADVNCDGGVDNDDVAFFFDHWGDGC